MSTYVYPSAAELKAVEQDLIPVLTADDPVFDIFPMEDSDYDAVIWEKFDMWTGLMQVRGVNGRPPVAIPPGQRQFTLTPGYYGEVRPIDELEITRRRQMGTFGTPINIDFLVRQAQDYLLTRQLNRIRYECWTLLATGSYVAFDAKGAAIDQISYTPRTYNATVTWATSATATPLLDFRNVQLFQRGYSLSFGPGAVAYMNQVTANALFSNTNAADMYGRRTQGLGTYNSPTQINQLLAGDNLPTFVVYDEGYRDDNGVFQPFLPNNKVIVVGKRTTGVPLGAFKMTRNVNNENLAPGAYTKVVDRGLTEVPRTIEVHRGFNGAPMLAFPTGVVVMNV